MTRKSQEKLVRIGGAVTGMLTTGEPRKRAAHSITPSGVSQHFDFFQKCQLNIFLFCSLLCVF